MSDKNELLKYCEDILKLAPHHSIEYKVAKIAYIKIKGLSDEVSNFCRDIIEKSPDHSIQNEIANIVLSENVTHEGWTLVPIEPTEEMFRFVPLMARMTINKDEYDYSRHNEKNARWVYLQMLRYAPEYKNK